MHNAYFAMKAVTMTHRTHLDEFKKRLGLQLRAYIRFIMITMNTTSDLRAKGAQNVQQLTVHSTPKDVRTPHNELIPYET